MKLLIPLALLGAALGVQACAPGAGTSTRTALDCPPSQGALMRTNAAADGRSCTYRTSDGAQVYLQLVSGDARATLRTLEAAVTAEAAAAKATAATVKSATANAADGSQAAKDAASVEAEVDRDIVVAGKYGVHVSDTGDGEHGRAKVNLPGLQVDASDGGAKVRIAGMRVDASEEGAVVSYPRDVRLKGEAFSPEKRGVRATYLYTASARGEGHSFLGYEAAGPKTGPLTVAAVRAKGRRDNNGEMYPDVEKLVRKNGGV